MKRLYVGEDGVLVAKKSLTRKLLGLLGQKHPYSYPSLLAAIIFCTLTPIGQSIMMRPDMDAIWDAFLILYLALAFLVPYAGFSTIGVQARKCYFYPLPALLYGFNQDELESYRVGWQRAGYKEIPFNYWNVFISFVWGIADMAYILCWKMWFEAFVHLKRRLTQTGTIHTDAR